MASTQRGARPVSAPVFSQAALAEAGIPMAPFEQPQTSTPIKMGLREERRLEVTVEAVEPSKMEAVVEVKVFDFSFLYCSLKQKPKRACIGRTVQSIVLAPYRLFFM